MGSSRFENDCFRLIVSGAIADVAQPLGFIEGWLVAVSVVAVWSLVTKLLMVRFDQFVSSLVVCSVVWRRLVPLGG